MLLTQQEVLRAWEITHWHLTKKINEHREKVPMARVQRPGYQPYYPFSAVKKILGEPIHDPRPRKHSGFELAAAA